MPLRPSRSALQPDSRSSQASHVIRNMMILNGCIHHITDVHLTLEKGLVVIGVVGVPPAAPVSPHPYAAGPARVSGFQLRHVDAPIHVGRTADGLIDHWDRDITGESAVGELGEPCFEIGVLIFDLPWCFTLAILEAWTGGRSYYSLREMWESFLSILWIILGKAICKFLFPLGPAAEVAIVDFGVDHVRDIIV